MQRQIKSGRVFLGAMSMVMILFVLVFIRSYQPSFDAYGAVLPHSKYVTIKGHVTVGTTSLQSVIVRVLENENKHWNVVATGWTNKGGLYNIKVPTPTWPVIKVEWTKKGDNNPTIVHPFAINHHSTKMAFDLKVSNGFKLLAAQMFSY